MAVLYDFALIIVFMFTGYCYYKYIVPAEFMHEEYVSGKLGSNYVNWGNENCPHGSKTIYSGYSAKGHAHKKGGGSNFVCLTKQPTRTSKQVAGIQEISLLFGVEYWAHKVERFFPHKNAHQNMPCSVCEIQGRSQTLMIPGRIECPSNWQSEYVGYLMAERTGHDSASDFICVNENYEFLVGGAAYQESAYVVPVEVSCGVLPCPPYQEGLELMCAVCSK